MFFRYWSKAQTVQLEPSKQTSQLVEQACEEGRGVGRARRRGADEARQALGRTRQVPEVVLAKPMPQAPTQRLLFRNSCGAQAVHVVLLVVQFRQLASQACGREGGAGERGGSRARQAPERAASRRPGAPGRSWR